MLEEFRTTIIHKDEFICKDFIREKCQDVVVANMITADMIKKITKPTIFVTGCDYTIDEKTFRSVDCENIKVWFAHNVLYKHPKLHSLPVALPNPSNNKTASNFKVIEEANSKEKNIRNLAYIGFRDDTFIGERSKVRKLFEGKNFVSTADYDKTCRNGDYYTDKGYRGYINDIYNHKFVFSPRGNGVDCHRHWESLYLRTIPIIKKDSIMEFAKDLPILFVNDWEEALDVSYLEKKYDEIMNKEYDLGILKLSFWIEKIKGYS